MKKPRKKLDEQLAELRAHLDTKRKEHAEIVRESKPKVAAARKAHVAAQTARAVAHTALHRRESALLRELGWTPAKARKRLVAWAGLTSDDVEAGAHVVLGHDLLGEAYEAIRKRVCEADPAWSKLSVEAEQHDDRTHQTGWDLNQAERPAEKVRGELCYIERQILDIEEKRARTATRKDRSASRTGTADREAATRRAAARKRLREELDSFPLPKAAQGKRKA
jgi:hypothetical protein